MKVILLLHLYQDKFLEQKLLWVEVTSSEVLQTLLGHFAAGRRLEDLHGTEAYPTEGEDFQCLQRELSLFYQNLSPGLSKKLTSIRVMQVIEGWPWEVPNVLSFMG